MDYIKKITLLGALMLLSVGGAFAQKAASITGQVVDSLGAVVVGATVTAVNSEGKEKKANTNDRGEFTIAGLDAGTYTIKAEAANFAPYENPDLVLAAGEKHQLIVSMTVAGVAEDVNVNPDEGVSTDAESNASATVLKGKDLDALPDDPDELQSALQALAGPGSGPDGGQIYIDGFTGGNLPPKESIREIRINQNPFSAEFDRVGWGRIEILTRPGTDRFRGSAFFNFNDARLNSRNPFAANRAPSQTRFFGGNISGPIIKKKASFFVDVSNRDIDNNTIVNAVVLDPSFNIVNFSQDYKVPTRRFSIGPRLDYAINDKNTLVVRYDYDRSSSKNQGIGGTSLASRQYDSTSFGHEFRITETSILNATTVNETRFQYSFDKSAQNGDNSVPTVSVSSAFTSGGSQIGESFNQRQRYEISNNTTTALGKNMEHSVKFGIRLRGTTIDNRSENNYGGTFSFLGFVGASPYDLNGDGFVSPIEQYRAKLLGAVGTQYDPTQFTMTTGDPLAKVSQQDLGVFVSDDWRLSPKLLLSFGLRYENQTNISSDYNFAPRFGFAWSPGAGGSKPAKTVFRGGAGIFYDRFSENYTLQAHRYDGITQLNLLVSANETDPTRQAAAIALLAQPIFNPDGTVSNVLTPSQILAFLPGSSTTRLVATDLKTPYTAQATVGVERQLPFKTTLSAFYIISRSFNQLRSRNINAPVCPTELDCSLAPRPDPTLGNIQQYEATGRSEENQIRVGFRNNYSSRFSLFGNYSLNFSKSDTDGAGSAPAYSYSFAGEWGRSGDDVRHRFVIGGNIGLPWGVSLNPFIFASSGSPFNITTGFDSNGDGYITERPTYGALASRCAELGLNYAFCDIAGKDPNAIIPRNYGEGPGSFSVNMRVSKNFGFGKLDDKGGQAGQGGGMMGMGRGGFFGGMGGSRKPYNLNVSVNFSNLLNTVNLGNPVSSLSSSRFGQSTSTSGGFGRFGGSGGSANRRIELQVRFSW